ncbi:hypothetical protein BDP27DRAFT_1367939 [Rhodocollybia butyracea]|uniref:Uncharacterized protein n=1 Tax=Rhodocollybia butyracea TaxID=206335 RepID=A0A9P5U245_9AGAR|nr:hypothetical protein BDP27DRAFT_1367939 [Rhodocollybia butyracea]
MIISRSYFPFHELEQPVVYKKRPGHNRPYTIAKPQDTPSVLLQAVSMNVNLELTIRLDGIFSETTLAGKFARDLAGWYVRGIPMVSGTPPSKTLGLRFAHTRAVPPSFSCSILAPKTSKLAFPNSLLATGLFLLPKILEYLINKGRIRCLEISSAWAITGSILPFDPTASVDYLIIPFVVTTDEDDVGDHAKMSEAGYHAQEATSCSGTQKTT